MPENGAKPDPHHPRTDSNCVYKNVARLLAEEPRLEAVAFQPKNQLLSMATLGDDRGQRIADRVTEAVADREQQCGVLDARGLCAECGVAPSQKVGDANVVVKDVLGSTVIEKLTCRTAVGFWRWNKLRWPGAADRGACCGHGGVDADPNEWKTLAWLSLVCFVSGLAAITADRMHAAAALVLTLFVISYISGAWDAAVESWERLRHGDIEIHFL